VRVTSLAMKMYALLSQQRRLTTTQERMDVLRA
jgi:hypothetical protein